MSLVNFQKYDFLYNETGSFLERRRDLYKLFHVPRVHRVKINQSINVVLLLKFLEITKLRVCFYFEKPYNYLNCLRRGCQE